MDKKQEKEFKKQEKEFKRQDDLLKSLNQREEFHIWKDFYALAELEKIEIQKKNIMGKSEAEVKALILYETFIKDLFKNMFKNL